MNVLSINNVNKDFSGNIALNDVSLDIKEGCIFGLLGPNGAGKTTLIRIINQIIAPDSGEVHLNGEPLKRDHIHDIGYLPEERGLYRKMTVGEQAMYLAKLKGLSDNEAKKRILNWFEKFEMEGWWDKKIEELSKGMAQKIQFITTVIHEPKLLILDEPFSGFDPINAELVKEEVKRFKENGTSIILSTHNMESVEKICEQIALINKAEKILDGDVEQIRNQYGSRIYEIEFKGNLIAFSNALWTNFKLIDREQIDNSGEVFKARVELLGNSDPNDLLNTILPHTHVYSFKPYKLSMQEIFIKAVQERKEGSEDDKSHSEPQNSEKNE
ncbi:MAG: ABC transporter ATP-binding protein [Flavobacteriales bacterium]